MRQGDFSGMEAWREFFFDILEKRYKALSGKNPRFSQRAFARMAKVSPAAMSNLLKRKTSWKLKPERALIICSSIGATPQQINRLAALSYQKVTYESTSLLPSTFDVLLDPNYLTIYLSFDLRPRRTTEELATCLKLAPDEVESIIKRLLAKKLLKRNTEGEIVGNTDENIMSSDDIPSEIISQHHVANLKALLRATEELPMEVRDVTSMTFLGNREQMPLIKKEIREFHQRVNAIMDQGDLNNEVFKFVIGIAPMTLVNKKASSRS